MSSLSHYDDEIYDAIDEENIELMERLAKNREHPINLNTKFANEILFATILWRRVRALAWLLNKEPEVNFLSDDGFTPLK